MESLRGALILLSVGVLFVTFTLRLRLPPLLAYLAAGILVGPHGLALIPESHQIDTLAELGVVFLMFSIGLEFSLGKLKAMHRLVFGLGGGQVILTLIGTVAVARFFYHQGWREGVAVGAAVAMSSTAIVSKLLSERLELHSDAGRQTMAVLLFQDLAVVPLLITLPALATKTSGLLASLSLAMLQAGLVLAAMIFLGQKLMHRWFDAVVRQRSPELFMLNVLWIVVGLSFLTAAAGLSLALGAFVGGMLISETMYRHQVEADIRPFRDILLGLFFITLGMQLDLAFVAQSIGSVVIALALLILGKGGVVLLLCATMRNSTDTAVRTAIQLAQGGEFGFVLLTLGLDLHLVPGDVFQVTTAALLLSMFLAPFLIARAGKLGKRLSAKDFAQRAKMVQEVAARAMDVENHVIVCGFGRSGQTIARFLEAEDIPFIALDVDPVCIEQAQKAGERVVFGNADRLEVLMAAGLQRARAVVITYNDLSATEKVLFHTRDARPDMPVVVRSADDSNIDHLKSLGATEVIPEVLEGGLMMAAQTLAELGVPVERAVGQVRAARAERYGKLKSYYRGEKDRMKRLAEEKSVFVVEAGSATVGRALSEVMPASSPVRVERVKRGEVRIDNPAADLALEGGDVLLLSGPPDALLRLEKQLAAG